MLLPAGLRMQAGSGGSRATPAAGGQRSYVSVLFSDLVGSTRLAAELDMDSYAELLELVRAEGNRIIGLFGGAIAQIYGDGLLAIFEGAGSPVRAIEAAMRLHRAVASIAMPAQLSAGALGMHSGIHAGLVLLRPGDAARGTVEALGRTTAVASRLSAAARAGEILVSATSLGPSREALPLGPARAVDIGDGTAPVAAHPVLASAADAPAETLAATPWVGRAGLVAHFAALLDRLRAGDGFGATLLAPPGQGKSRFAREVAALARARGCRVLAGTCSAAETVAPLHPFRAIAAQLGADDPANVESLLAAALADAPHLLLLDDWQWADSASAALLARIRARGGPLGLLLLARADDSDRVPIDGQEEIRLPPLDAAETQALVAALRPEFDPLDAMRIHARAGGNPLFVEELCRLDPRAARILLPDGSEPAGSGWVASLVAARVRQLPAGAQTLLEAAAVVGLVAPRWLLVALMGEAALVRDLPALAAADLLQAGPDGDMMLFKHGLTREIIYSLIPLAVRRSLHGRIAEVLEARADTPGIDRAEALAWHFMAGDQPARCWPQAEIAGDHAMALASLDRARLHFRMAIDSLERLEEPAFDIARYTALVGKYGYVSIYDADRAQLPVFEAAMRRAAARGDTVAEAQAGYWAGYVAHGSGDTGAAIRHCRAALALTAPDDQSPLAVQLRATLGQALAVAGRYAEAVPLLDDSIAVKRAHRSGRRASVGLAYALTQRAAVAADTGDFARAHAMIDEALALIGDAVEPVESSIMGWKAAICGWQGDWAGMAAAGQRGCDIARRIDVVYVHAICRAFAAFARWQQTGESQAVDDLAAAVACMTGRGKALTLSIALGFLAEAEAARGNREGARWAVAQAYGRARAGDVLGLAQAARAWARCLAACDPRRARVFLARARRAAHRRGSGPEIARCAEEEARLFPGQPAGLRAAAG